MATRFWVGGTGSWDGVDTTHWAATTGGAGGQSAPGAADTITFDAASGGGTVTVTADLSIFSIAAGAFTGTLDFNGHNVALAGGTTAFTIAGTGTRVITLGTGTFTVAGAAGSADLGSTSTNLTFSGASATFSFTSTAATGARSLTLPIGGTLGAFSVANNTKAIPFTIAGGTITTATIGSGNTVNLTSTNIPVFGSLTLNGTSSAPCNIKSNSDNSATLTVTINTSATFNWTAIRQFTAGGAGTVTTANCFDLQGNGITINAPTGGGGGSTGFPASRAYLGAN